SQCHYFSACNLPKSTTSITDIHCVWDVILFCIPVDVGAICTNTW
ncbi:2712_t:CDS:1, partial [Racocetra persica]